MDGLSQHVHHDELNYINVSVPTLLQALVITQLGSLRDSQEGEWDSKWMHIG